MKYQLRLSWDKVPWSHTNIVTNLKRVGRSTFWRHLCCSFMSYNTPWMKSLITIHQHNHNLKYGVLPHITYLKFGLLWISLLGLCVCSFVSMPNTVPQTTAKQTNTDCIYLFPLDSVHYVDWNEAQIPFRLGMIEAMPPIYSAGISCNITKQRPK